MKATKPYGLAAGAIASLIALLGCQTPSGPTAASSAARGTSTDSAGVGGPAGDQLAARGTNVDVCHRTGGDSPFIFISVDDHAVAEHIAHGDGRPGQGVPDRQGSVFGADCEITERLACPCWAEWTEPQLLALLVTDFGAQQANCTASGTDVFARGVNGNTTEIAAIQSEMSCTLRTSTASRSVTSLSPDQFAICLEQAQRIVPQLGVCFD